MSSSAFRGLLGDRRLWLLVLCTVSALVLGVVVVPDSYALPCVRYAGYWMVLATFSVFAWSLFRVLAGLSAQHGGYSKLVDKPLLGVCLLGLVGLMVHESAGFKIINDELMLLGTSMSMHFDRQALSPLRGHDLQGAFVLMDGVVDKRPLFFPFLTSLVHDLSGYRPANVFFLNGILTGVFLYLVGLMGRLFAGRPGQVLAVVLFAGLPLLGHNTLGGGFEVLNLVMITVTFLLAVHHAKSRSADSLTALVYSGMLLAQTRYESVLFVLPVAAIVLWVWLREGETRLSWSVMLCPLLLVLVPLHFRVFSLKPSAWEMASQPGYTTPFSLSYLSQNFAHAVNFFFSAPHEQPNSLVLSFLGWIGVPFSMLLILQWFRARQRFEALQMASLVFFIALSVQFLFLMTYFWGRFDDVVIRRLSLPTHLWLVLAALMALPQLVKSVRIQWGLVGVALVGYLAMSVPSMARHAYSQEYLPGLEVAWRRRFITEQPSKDYLMIDNDCSLWVTHQVSCTFVPRAKERPDIIQFDLKNHCFSNIYAFQRYMVDPETGKETLRAGDDLGPDYELQLVREERLQTLSVDRISRVVAVRKGDTVVRAGNVSTVPTVSKDAKQIEEIRAKYLENFLKQLP